MEVGPPPPAKKLERGHLEDVNKGNEATATERVKIRKAISDLRARDFTRQIICGRPAAVTLKAVVGGAEMRGRHSFGKKNTDQGSCGHVAASERRSLHDEGR